MSYVPSGQSDFKKPVRVATTANLNLSSPGSSIDGVTLSDGDRVLVKNQSSSAANGIYIFDSSSTPMIRANDANSDGELDGGTMVIVEAGSVNADTAWIVSTNGSVDIGTTSISFAQLTGGGGSSSASGISYAGSTNLSASDVESALDELDTEKAAVSHSHAIGDVTGLQAALDAKAGATHSHSISDVTGLQSALDAKATSSHSHAISDVTNLQSTLNGKAASSHSHAISDVTGLQTALDGKASSSHSHNGIVPIGGIIDYYGSTEPSGWLFPNGQAINQSLYPDAYSLIGANTPDLRGRVAVMRDASAGVLTGTDTLGSAEGSQTHTLTTQEIPSHTHGIGTLAAAGHQINTSTSGTGSAAMRSNSSSGSFSQSISFSGSLANTGSGNSHQNMQPSMRVNKLIRVL